MLKTIVLSAIGAGIAVAVCLTATQRVTTVPLILHAEVYEFISEHAHDPTAAATSEADPTLEALRHALKEESWQPSNGLERTLYTALANLVVGVGAALLLLGAMTAKGETIDGSRGVLWGIGGFLAASLLPALGLPPELPGSPATEITMRQLWWIATAIASAAGLALMVFGGRWLLRVAGLALLVLPHLVGPPEQPIHGATYPSTLAGEFAVASLVVSCLLWCLSGLVGGWLHQRLASPR